MKTRLKRLLSGVLALAMVMAMMPTMSMTAFAKTPADDGLRCPKADGRACKFSFDGSDDDSCQWRCSTHGGSWYCFSHTDDCTVAFTCPYCGWRWNASEHSCDDFDMDLDYHYGHCTRCSDSVEGPHTYGANDKCTVCGTDRHYHTWSDWECLPDVHTRSCTNDDCYAEEMNAHDFKNGDGICTVCNYKCSHNWDDMNGVCKICKKVCDHDWPENWSSLGSSIHYHTCRICHKDETSDHEWNRTTSQCSKCGETCTHSYGYFDEAVYTCQLCGYVDESKKPAPEPTEPFEETIDGIKYLLDPTTLTATITGHDDTVTKINVSTVTSGTKEYTVTAVAFAAFVECSDLTSINLPKVTSIDEIAFSECSNLTSVSMPEATSIGVGAFQKCTSLASIELPKVTSIGNAAFAECYNLTSVSMPKATSIGVEAFYYCSNLISVSMPKAISFGESAFSHCSNLMSVSMPEATSIPDGTFEWCASLTSIKLPKVTSIGCGAFDECNSLASIELPKVTSIDDYAFGNCFDTTVTLPCSWKDDAESDPYDWHGGWEFNFKYVGHSYGSDNKCTICGYENPHKATTTYGKDDTNHWFTCSVEGCTEHKYNVTEHQLVEGACVCGVKARIYMKDDTLYVLADGVSPNDYDKFKDDIKHIVFTEGVSYIYYFGYMPNLETVTFSSTITRINSNAFSYCYKLKKVSLNEGLETIASNVFFNCTSLTDINFPSTLKTIEGYAFSYCYSLTDVTFPAALTSIGDSAFQYCTSLKNVVFEHGVSVAGNTFSNCTGLESVTFCNDPAQTTTIQQGQPHFNSCSSLKEVVLGASVKTIPGAMFIGCSKLEKLVIGNKDIVLNSNSFANVGSQAKPATLILPEDWERDVPGEGQWNSGWFVLPVCEHDWSNNDGVCAACGKTCIHNWADEDGVCTICNKHCTHDWSDEDGQCSICWMDCPHTEGIENGKCKTCGVKGMATVDLLAKMDGADYVNAENGMTITVAKDASGNITGLAFGELGELSIEQLGNLSAYDGFNEYFNADMYVCSMGLTFLVDENGNIPIVGGDALFVRTEFTHEASTNYGSDETNHWFTCSVEGCTEHTYEPAAHTFENGVCTVCGYECTHSYKETGKYSWVNVDNSFSLNYDVVCEKCAMVTAEKAEISKSTSAGKTTYTATTPEGKTYTKTVVEKIGVTYQGETTQYDFATILTLTADTEVDWLANGVKVGTGSKTYTFAVTKDVEITTVEASKAEPIVRLNVDRSNPAKAVLSLEWTMPKGYTLVEAGIYRNLNMNETQLNATAPKVSTLKTTNGTYELTMNLSAASQGKSVSAKGYIKYKTPTGAVKILPTAFQYVGPTP